MKDTSFNVITDEDVSRGVKIFSRYKSAKAPVEKRFVASEEWWQGRVSSGKKNGASWLFNAIANKHADAMDNMPSPVVLPRERSDADAAKSLSQIIPVVLERGDFEKVYSDVWYDKLKRGAGCYGVFWDNTACRGRGDVKIARVDLLNLFWQGGVEDIQRSENLFYTSFADENEIKKLCPSFKSGGGGTSVFDGVKYFGECSEDTEGKRVVVDWYYKKKNALRDEVHLIKFCDGKLLYASENDEACKNGIYDHGLYPFFIDSLYSVPGSPCGFGLVDVLKNTQSDIDRLSAAIVKNAELSSAVRYFIRTDGSVNEEEFADFTKPFVHVQGSRLGEDSLRQIGVRALDPVVVRILANKIDELKETAGNRDFTQGGVTGGITAASAITALQEAGNKLSRDMIGRSFGVFKSVIQTVIELIRQFYTLPRTFRILGASGSFDFVNFSSSPIARRNSEALGYSFGEFAPEFDVAVSAEKKSPFARVTQNELAKEFFAMGLFSPERREEAAACFSMMDFEGKDELLSKLSEITSGGPSKYAAPTSPLTDAVERASYPVTFER
ncbi:MAG: hypothetical protein IJS45_02895 [Clostridia bacterium]|nr:hypothetical protein [Clostridia bacterium]